MRPSFPTPQGLQPICHPSKFSPRTERIQGTIQVRLSFQIDGFLTGPSQLKGDTQPVNQTECLVLFKVLQNVFRIEFSHQTRDLECFADRHSIPWNLLTNFHSDLIATIRQRCLPLLCALLFRQYHLFPIVWCRRTMIP